MYLLLSFIPRILEFLLIKSSSICNSISILALVFCDVFLKVLLFFNESFAYFLFVLLNSPLPSNHSLIVAQHQTFFGELFILAWKAFWRVSFTLFVKYSLYSFFDANLLLNDNLELETFIKSRLVSAPILKRNCNLNSFKK